MHTVITETFIEICILATFGTDTGSLRVSFTSFTWGLGLSFKIADAGEGTGGEENDEYRENLSGFHDDENVCDDLPVSC